jgi:hypothetical protein
VTYILPPLVAWAVAQVCKIIVEAYRKRRLDLTILAKMGGMPSSHTAMVIALTTALGRLNGPGSPVFGLALIFSLVVMYDAAGVRRAAGRQAAVLNRVVDDLREHRGFHEDRLLELLGHTPFEVFAGAAIGVVTGIVFTL